ncbi:MAG TPA: restriction alleviation protein [Caudoviricetes sp.]|nr:MAG TPA: restriction alleviation protein [Caudoviricetes sp.]
MNHNNDIRVVVSILLNTLRRLFITRDFMPSVPRRNLTGPCKFCGK